MTANHRTVTDEELDNTPGMLAFLRPRTERAMALGKVEGKAEGKAESVLLILQARGLVIDPEIHSRITECRDIATLERWLIRSTTITSVDQLFIEE